MATIQHSALTDPEVHEPKDITTADAGAVYVADGAGSGAWQQPAGHAYGELYISEGATSQTLAAASGTAKLNPTAEWTTNGNANVTLSAANGTITITHAGEYSLNFWITFTTASIAAGAKYRFYYAVNGVHGTRNVFVTKPTNGADTVHCSASGLATLAVNDVVTIYVGGDSTSSSTAITPVEAGFSVQLIQPT
jgi:hypothetical protein